MRGLVVALILMGLSLHAGCEAPPEPMAAPEWETGALERLHWLAGRWVGIDDEGVATEESWTDPAAGAMFGVNRTIAGDATIFFEFLRIEVNESGDIVYRAQPRGRSPATPFTLTEWGEGRYSFTNPEHDFPKRITYERIAADQLLMTIAGDSAPPRSWRLHRMRPEP